MSQAEKSDLTAYYVIVENLFTMNGSRLAPGSCLYRAPELGSDMFVVALGVLEGMVVQITDEDTQISTDLPTSFPPPHDVEHDDLWFDRHL